MAMGISLTSSSSEVIGRVGGATVDTLHIFFLVIVTFEGVCTIVSERGGSTLASTGWCVGSGRTDVERLRDERGVASSDREGGRDESDDVLRWLFQPLIRKGSEPGENLQPKKQ
jgi:hypothetical protein